MEKFETILKCVACDSEGNNLIQISKDILKCKSCKKEFIRDKTDKFYNLYIGERKAEGVLLDQVGPVKDKKKVYRKYVVEKMVSELRKLLKGFSITNLIDIGCGNGIYSKILKGLYVNYYGFEPSGIPSHKKINEDLPDKTFLVRYDTEKTYPLIDKSCECIIMLATYDHIPEIKPVLQDVYKKIHPGGRFIILMTNYGFWAKRVVNFITGKKKYMHKDHHFRVHTPQTLIKEITENVNLKKEKVAADFILLPNMPNALSFLYNYRIVLRLCNNLLQFIFKLLRIKNSGSVQIVTFLKE